MTNATRLDKKIQFLKANEALARIAFVCKYDSKHELTKDFIQMAKDANVYAKNISPIQVFHGLLRCAENNIGWNFDLNI